MKNRTSNEIGLHVVVLHAVILTLTTSMLNSGPLDNWTLQDSGTANALSVVTYGQNQFVAVGLGGTIVTSPDGATWTQRPSGTALGIVWVAYGNNQYVAVGENGLILTSPDGVTWTQRSAPTTLYLLAVDYGNNLFVAVGQNRIILTSPNGINWTQRGGTMFDDHLYSVHSFNNMFIATGECVCDLGGTVIWTSPDAVNWTPRQNGKGWFVSDVAFDGQTFVAVGRSYMPKSTDGIDWTLSASPASVALNSIVFAEGRFVTVGYRGEILSSADGIAWTQHAASTVENLFGVCFGNATLVAVGENGTILQSGYLGAPKLSADADLAAGVFKLSVRGEIGRDYLLQATTNLAAPNWTDVTTFNQSQETMSVQDPDATNYPARFYRVFSP
jgi:hypothetical protein